MRALITQSNMERKVNSNNKQERASYRKVFWYAVRTFLLFVLLFVCLTDYYLFNRRSVPVEAILSVCESHTGMRFPTTKHSDCNRYAMMQVCRFVFVHENCCIYPLYKMSNIDNTISRDNGVQKGYTYVHPDFSLTNETIVEWFRMKYDCFATRYNVCSSNQSDDLYQVKCNGRSLSHINLLSQIVWERRIKPHYVCYNEVDSCLFSTHPYSLDLWTFRVPGRSCDAADGAPSTTHTTAHHIDRQRRFDVGCSIPARARRVRVVDPDTDCIDRVACIHVSCGVAKSDAKEVFLSFCKNMFPHMTYVNVRVKIMYMYIKRLSIRDIRTMEQSRFKQTKPDCLSLCLIRQLSLCLISYMLCIIGMLTEVFSCCKQVIIIYVLPPFYFVFVRNSDWSLDGMDERSDMASSQRFPSSRPLHHFMLMRDVIAMGVHALRFLGTHSPQSTLGHRSPVIQVRGIQELNKNEIIDCILCHTRSQNEPGIPEYKLFMWVFVRICVLCHKILPVCSHSIGTTIRYIFQVYMPNPNRNLFRWNDVVSNIVRLFYKPPVDESIVYFNITTEC